MRKIAVACAVVVSALALAATASASSISGIVYAGNSGAPSAAVYIHNNTTGANGSTYADGNGNYYFGGTVAGDSYTLHAEWRNGCYFYVSDYVTTNGDPLYVNLYLTNSSYQC